MKLNDFLKYNHCLRYQLIIAENNDQKLAYGKMDLQINTLPTKGYGISIQKTSEYMDTKIQEKMEIQYNSQYGLVHFFSEGEMNDYHFKVQADKKFRKIAFHALVNGEKQQFHLKQNEPIVDNNSFFVFLPMLLEDGEETVLNVLLPNFGKVLPTKVEKTKHREKVLCGNEEIECIRYRLSAVEYPDLVQYLLYDIQTNRLIKGVNGKELLVLEEK